MFTNYSSLNRTPLSLSLSRSNIGSGMSEVLHSETRTSAYTTELMKPC